MTPIKFNSPQQFIDALEARRPLLAKIDADRLTEHRKAEAAYLKAFKAGCRDAAKWDYKTAKENHFDIKVEIEGTDGKTRACYGGPICPRSEIARLDSLIDHLRLTRQKRFTVTRNGDWAIAWDLLTLDPDAPDASLCA